MYIHEFRVRNYRNFYKNFVSFTSSINTIIGENSTGKTNLFYSLKKKEKIYSRLFSSSVWKVCREKI